MRMSPSQDGHASRVTNARSSSGPRRPHECGRPSAAREQLGGLVLVEQGHAHQEPEHGAADRLGQARRIVGGPRHKGPIGPEAAVRHEEVQVWKPVGPRAMRFQAGHDAHGELALADQRTNGGGHGAVGDAGDLAEQASAVATVRAARLGMLSTTWRCGTGASSVVSSHRVQSASR